ncbi:MAG: TetR/AcrR family transcriptional regulator [Candidatus Eisenbacteria bacterium]|nr:TetR/AcrR family transcriptional regulator [Candidatus Eisenbacteria bacterium]
MTRIERKEEGRVDILRAAAGLLAQRGYHGMSMRHLAAATGMSLANLYNYFGSKEDLLFALQTRAFETLIAMAEEVSATVAAGEARLHAFILTHVRYVAGHAEVMRVLVEEAGELPPPHRRAVRAMKERYFRLGLGIVRGIVGRGSAKGAGQAMDERALERATYHIFGMLNWVYAWYDPARHGTPQDVARSIHGLALCGLRAPWPARAALSATERRVARVEVRSPIHLHRKGAA